MVPPMAGGLETTESVLTVEEAAARAKISKDLLYDLIRTRKGPRVKRLSNRIRITVTEFNRWINPAPKKVK